MHLALSHCSFLNCCWLFVFGILNVSYKWTYKPWSTHNNSFNRQAPWCIGVKYTRAWARNVVFSLRHQVAGKNWSQKWKMDLSSFSALHQKLKSMSKHGMSATFRGKNESSRRISKLNLGLFFYLIWAYRGCFEPGSTARHLFVLLSQQAVRDAPPWGTWIGTLHCWRKGGKDRRASSRIQIHDLLFMRRALYLLCYNHGPRAYVRFASVKENLKLFKKGPFGNQTSESKLVEKRRRWFFFHFKINFIAGDFAANCWLGFSSRVFVSSRMSQQFREYFGSIFRPEKKRQEKEKDNVFFSLSSNSSEIDRIKFQKSWFVMFFFLEFFLLPESKQDLFDFFLQKTDPGFVFPHSAAEGWAEKNNETGIETKLGNRNPDWTCVVFKVGSAI